MKNESLKSLLFPYSAFRALVSHFQFELSAPCAFENMRE